MAASTTGAERSSIQVAGEINKLERSAVTLVAQSMATKDYETAPQATVSITVPEGSVFITRVDRLTLGCSLATPESQCLSWMAQYQLSDGTRNRIKAGAVRLRTAGEPLELGPGSHQLRLRYVRLRGGMTTEIIGIDNAESADNNSGETFELSSREDIPGAVVIIERAEDTSENVG